jgi:hypothetical protein
MMLFRHPAIDNDYQCSVAVFRECGGVLTMVSGVRLFQRFHESPYLTISDIESALLLDWIRNEPISRQQASFALRSVP